jgi:hypothetical protein
MFSAPPGRARKKYEFSNYQSILGKTPGIESRSPGKLVAVRYILFKLATSPIIKLILQLNHPLRSRREARQERHCDRRVAALTIGLHLSGVKKIDERHRRNRKKYRTFRH